VETVAVPAPKDGAAAEPRQAARSLRVMVVDDNTDAAHSLGVWLETHGHHVTVMHHAWSALLAAMSEPAEVYVLDIGLPEMDGYELARRLRSLEGGQAATLVALTGYGQPADRERAREAGFDVHMTKPMDPDALARLLAQAADRPAFR
jgi:CheY-like chemotaxis protein